MEAEAPNTYTRIANTTTYLPRMQKLCESYVSCIRVRFGRFHGVPRGPCIYLQTNFHRTSLSKIAVNIGTAWVEERLQTYLAT